MFIGRVESCAGRESAADQRPAPAVAPRPNSALRQLVWAHIYEKKRLLTILLDKLDKYSILM